MSGFKTAASAVVIKPAGVFTRKTLVRESSASSSSKSISNQSEDEGNGGGENEDKEGCVGDRVGEGPAAEGYSSSSLSGGEDL